MDLQDNRRKRFVDEILHVHEFCHRVIRLNDSFVLLLQRTVHGVESRVIFENSRNFLFLFFKQQNAEHAVFFSLIKLYPDSHFLAFAVTRLHARGLKFLELKIAVFVHDVLQQFFLHFPFFLTFPLFFSGFAAIFITNTIYFLFVVVRNFKRYFAFKNVVVIVEIINIFFLQSGI